MYISSSSAQSKLYVGAKRKSVHLEKKCVTFNDRNNSVNFFENTNDDRLSRQSDDYKIVQLTRAYEALSEHGYNQIYRYGTCNQKNLLKLHKFRFANEDFSSENLSIRSEKKYIVYVIGQLKKHVPMNPRLLKEKISLFKKIAERSGQFTQQEIADL